MGISNVYILDIVLLRMMVASQPMWVHFNNVALQKYFAFGVDIALRGEQLVMLYQTTGIQQIQVVQIVK
jgi:hypothetical protein